MIKLIHYDSWLYFLHGQYILSITGYRKPFIINHVGNLKFTTHAIEDF